MPADRQKKVIESCTDGVELYARGQLLTPPIYTLVQRGSKAVTLHGVSSARDHGTASHQATSSAVEHMPP